MNSSLSYPITVFGAEKGTSHTSSTSGIVPGYRSTELLVRDMRTNLFESTDPANYQALIAPPAFAAGWGMQALEHDPAASILTASLNCSYGCPVGEGKLCGKYCFAWNAGNKGNVPVENLDIKYLNDMGRLHGDGKNVSIFWSYDTEPLAGEDVIKVTKKVLRAIMKSPPTSLLLHTRTAHTLDPELRALLRDVSQAAHLIVGVAVETDVENFGPHQHYHSVADRIKSLELMAKDGIMTQGTTTPMIGYTDYAGLIKKFADIGVGRIMLGKLKFTLPGGGAEEARALDSYGLHVPTEEEALAICAEHKFPGGANTRERFYVSMGTK